MAHGVGGDLLQSSVGPSDSAGGEGSPGKADVGTSGKPVRAARPAEQS